MGPGRRAGHDARAGGELQGNRRAKLREGSQHEELVDGGVLVIRKVSAAYGCTHWVGAPLLR